MVSSLAAIRRYCPSPFAEGDQAELAHQARGFQVLGVPSYSAVASVVPFCEADAPHPRRMIRSVEGEHFALVAKRVVIVVAGDQQPRGFALDAAVTSFEVAALDLVVGKQRFLRGPQTIPAVAARIEPVAPDHAVVRLDQHQRHARADHFAIAKLHVGTGQQHSAGADVFQPAGVVLLHSMRVAEMVQTQAAQMGIAAQLADRHVAPRRVVSPLVIGTDHQPPRSWATIERSSTAKSPLPASTVSLSGRSLGTTSQTSSRCWPRSTVLAGISSLPVIL